MSQRAPFILDEDINQLVDEHADLMKTIADTKNALKAYEKREAILATGIVIEMQKRGATLEEGNNTFFSDGCQLTVEKVKTRRLKPRALSFPIDPVLEKHIVNRREVDDMTRIMALPEGHPTRKALESVTIEQIKYNVTSKRVV